MRIAMAAYVKMAKHEGNTVFVCRPLVESQPEVRDPLLRVSLQRLANKARQMIHHWIETGHTDRIQNLLYDPDAVTKKLKLQLVLRDRTVHWKLLFVIRTAFGKLIAYTPSIPDLWFGIESAADLEHRAKEVMTKWCQDFLSENSDSEIPDLSLTGDAWVEPIDIDLSSLERKKRRSRNPFAAMSSTVKMRGDEELRKTGRCLDDLASEYSIAVGRQELVTQLDQLLQRPSKQPILLVGPSGTGKTAILEECILRRSKNLKELRKQGHQTWLLAPQRLISGMSYLGQWEERWLAILREATKKDHILYFDDPLGLLSAGVSRDSKLSVADVLKSYLAQHQVRIVAEITAEALAIFRRRDRGLADAFHLLPIPALDEEKTLAILQQIAGDIEAERKVFFHPSVLPTIIEKQRTLAPHLSFPGKGVEVLKNLSRWGQTSIGHNTLMAYLKQSTGVSARMLDPTSRSQGPLRDTLEQRLIGQTKALDAVERIAHRACYRLSPSDRPHGVLLFLGPTGVGKTECAKALNSALFADESHLIRFDMNEITTSFAAEQLIGTFDNPDGRLTSAVRKRPFSVILLDEIEKAHPDVFDYLLQVLGEGRLTDAHGRTIDFRNTVIIMTSNLGVQEDQSSLGFDSSQDGLPPDRQLAYERSAQRFFRPEFYNRIDEVVVFRRLDRSDVTEIAELQLGQLLQRDGMLRRDIFARVRSEVLEWVVDRGFDKELGARAMKRALETHLVEPLGDLLSETAIDSSLWADISLAAKENGLGAKTTRPNAAISGPICCQLQTLVSVPTTAVSKEHSIERWIELGERKVAEYSEALANLSGRLQDGVSSNEPNQIQYYTFHDQVFRCKEILKQLKHYSDQTETTLIQPMQTRPSAVKKSAGMRSTGERRFMMDYQSELDIHDAIADSATDRGEKRDLHELTRELRRTLSLTSSLLSNADQPTRWRVEMRYATRQPRGLSSVTDGDDLSLHYDNLQMPAVIGMWDNALHPTGYFLRALANTLSAAFQYDVSYNHKVPNQMIVSGSGVAGLIRSLVGTYRIESSYTGRDLAVLVAVPLPLKQKGKTDHEERSSPVLEWDPKSPNPSPFEFDWTRIRGLLTEGVQDFASNTSVQFQESRQHWAWWWNDLLPSIEPE